MSDLQMFILARNNPECGRIAVTLRGASARDFSLEPTRFQPRPAPPRLDGTNSALPSVKNCDNGENNNSPVVPERIRNPGR